MLNDGRHCTQHLDFSVNKDRSGWVV